MNKKILETKQLCKTFSTGGIQQEVLKNLDLEIYEGDFSVIMGTSSGGKSTLRISLLAKLYWIFSQNLTI